MPRPKRARVTPSAPVNTASRRAAVAESAKSSTSITRSSARKPLANLSNTASSVQTNSDSSDAVFGLVKNAPKGNRRQGGGVRDESAMMAGGLGEGEVPLRRTKRNQDIRKDRVQEKQAGSGRLDTQPTGQATRTVTRMNGNRKQESAAQGLGRREVRSDLAGAEPTQRDIVEDVRTETESNLLPKARTTSRHSSATENSRRVVSSPEKLEHGLQQIPSSVQRARHTPGGERSILALGNWKRRPRQPSIVRTARQQPSDYDIEDSFELPVSDDFNPDDESTPLKLTGAEREKKSGDHVERQAGESAQAASSSSRKRKRSPLVFQSDQLDEQHLPSSPPQIHSEPSHILPSDPAKAIGQRSTPVPEDEAESGRGPRPERNRTPEHVSETQASPRSSSPLDMFPDLQHRQSTKSGPETSRKAATRNASQAKQDKKSKRLTTAELTSFLPRRRAQRRRAANTPFEILNTSEQEDDSGKGLEEDEDELAPRRHKSRKSRTAPPAKKTQLPKSTKKGHRSKPAISSIQPSRPTELKRTYGRNSSDKENQEEEDEEPSEFMRDITNREEPDEEDDTVVTGDSRDRRKGREKRGKYRESLELSAAAKKFAEVDEWEMEFESVETGGRGSSPWR